MPRIKPDDAVKRRMWAALLKAAKRHHERSADRGMVTQIATDAGVSKAAVSDWKNLGNYPEPETLRRLAALYGVSAEELSGYVEGASLEARYGQASELLQRSTDMVEAMVDRLRPDTPMAEAMGLVRRANEMFMEGCSDLEVRGYLYDELTKSKEGEANTES